MPHLRPPAPARAGFAALVERLKPVQAAASADLSGDLATNLGVSLETLKAWVYKGHVARPETPERIRRLVR
jgi:hypothetical protein